MKQTIAFIMAIAVLTCTLSMTTFAATINYPVASVSSDGYVANDDGDLYLDKAASKVNYGKTVYFPLLSSSSSAVNTAKTAWENAVKAEPIAQTQYTTAVTAHKNANDALQVYYSAKSALDNYKNNFPRLNGILTDAKEVQAKVKKDHDDAVRALEEKKWETTELDSGKWQVYVEEAVALEKSTGEKLAAENTKVANAQKDVDALGNPTNLQNDVNAKQAALFSATGGTNSITAAEAEVENRRKTMESRNKEWGDAKTLITTTLKAYENARDNQYQFVYEPNAGDNVRVTPKWEESGNYVDKVEVIRKRVKSEIKGATTSSMQLIYFLAITIDKSSTTQSRDLLGSVTLKKSGSDGFTINANIGIELGYSNASGSDGEIGKTGRTFKDGDGFDAEDDFEFSFDADSKSKFVVDTRGQGKIVLSFNRDFDSKIERKYPDAILEFFNGNYASFNRVGDLFLGYSDDNGYVYEVSKTGELSRVSAKYDEDEDAFKISTRTLGRYVISNKKLAISSSSSSSSNASGSGTGTGTGTGTGGTGTTVVPTASSTPSYTYTPPASSAASSSTAPPAQSSSSSEEPEEESQSESEPDELEDEDDIVDVVIDDKDTEGPEEKSGIPVWVWVLIIVGLAAIPIGIGVVYYLHSRPLRRDFFNEEEDEYDDDDDEE